MALFQTSVLNKYLAEQDKDLLLAQYNIFKSYFLNPTIQNNIIAQKEEQFQEGFLRELFVKVLGYTINPEPDFNLTTELKNIKDAKKADGAIINQEKVLAVIELKGTDTTNLTKIEQQAFNYKNNQDGCRYVITSNFQKLRFYIDNAIEFIEWDLFKLDIEGFSLLYLCLAQNNIFNDLPAKIKTESVTVEEQVTKQLYKEYSKFRKSLFTNIVELNTNYNKLELFKKTQKLLDRFLFLFFAEDRLLVPPNSVRMILDQWTELKEKYDEYQPLYDRFKKYFGYLNTGYIGKQHEIFAYNGGLFAPDDILDSIKIDDATLYNATLGLSNYDYNSEVDVNILGHIFEHSLTEIEELEKEITSTDVVDTKTSKRKKDGVFYTPKYITKYIVENTVGTLCKNKKEELNLQEEDYHKLTKKAKKQLYDNLIQYREWLLHITIIDPACGSGAFLNQALEFLIAEHRGIAELEANIFNAPMVFDVESSILENNLFGVDINEESVEIAKLSLWLRTARKGRKLNSLNKNIKCGNSLIDDLSVAGDKAFNWQEQFPHIFERGGFDVVIGNPPYGDYFNAKEKEVVQNIYSKTYSGTFDIYITFYEKGISILKENGTLGYITPNTFIDFTQFKGLRGYLKNYQIKSILKMVEVFEDAIVDTAILILNKSGNGNYFFYGMDSKHKIFSIEESSLIEIDSSSLTQEAFLIKDNSTFDLNKFRKRYSNKLSNYVKITQGITTGDNDSFINERKYFLDNGINPNCIKKVLKGKTINRYNISYDDSYIIYSVKTLQEKEQELIQNLLLPFKDKLSQKRETKEGKLPWHCLHWSRNENDFNVPKILIRQTAEYIMGVMDNQNYYPIDTIHTLNLSIESTDISKTLNTINCIINSKLFRFLYQWYLNETGSVYPQIKKTNIEWLPMPDEDIILNSTVGKYSELIQNQFQTLNTFSLQFQKLLVSKFGKLNINSKLEKWYELSFTDFNKELTKHKIKLSLSEQSEWLTFFEQEKQKALAIKNEIDQTDMEIDQMVYQLYGLTEEEIKIVEGNGK